MPRKQFVSDFQAAQSQILHPSISDICKGDEDGSFTFLYTASDGQVPVELTAFIPDVSEYPSSHQYFLCAPDGCAPAIIDVINSTDTEGVKVADLLKRIGQGLDKAVVGKKQKLSQVEDVDYDDDLDEEMTYSDNEQEYDGDGAEDEDDDVVSVGGWSDGSAPDAGLDVEGDSQMDRDTSTPDSERWRAFCHDLRAVKRAGYKVGVLGQLPTLKGFISVSIKASKLGISDEAMTAWRIDPTRYLVLLLYFPGKYRGLGSFLNYSFSERKPAQFCVGISDKYKPTYDEAIDAFTKARKQPIEEEEDARNGSTDNKQAQEQEEKGTGFEGVFISRPLCELLNDRFFTLLKYRMIYGLEWDGAERFYDNFQGRERVGEQIDDVYYAKETLHRNLSALCCEDELQSSSKDTVSLPLVAMQFMLRHFVRCTEFCLVCHTKVQNNFEALKPYVCSKPLCLYQYMALGFGPSMEYEIISQPSVVDLLISFCYASAMAHKLNDFPVGLNLRVLPTAINPLLGVYHIETQQLTVTTSSIKDAESLRVGDWITMTSQGTTSDQAHCRVIEVDYFPKIKVAPPIGHKSSVNIFTPDFYNSADNVPIQFNVYHENFDKIDDNAKRSAIVHILETLPSVNEMRAWLLKNKKVGEQASLVQWKNRISPTACNLLRWIIASNRSCILQIDETPEDVLITDPLAATTSTTANAPLSPTGCVAGEERVWGMNGWAQFRFAMGAPDKEQRFVSQVTQTTASKACPTLFAWHGSPLQNWHSIIREGLHFKDTAHGRAYGHGCYHSLDLNTSLGYSGRYYYNQSTGSSFWPKSHLRIDSAICLNEIVNAPEQFVSKSPHLVVAQLDWIQTRYLFVKNGSGHNANNTDNATDKPERCINQDAGYTPRNAQGTSLVIPEAVSASRARQNKKQAAKVSSSKASVPSPAPKSKVGRGLKKIGKLGSKVTETVADFTETVSGSLGFKVDVDEFYYTDETDQEDIAILFHDDEENSKKGKEVSKPKKVDPDAFVPGVLDLTDIQLLSPPEYATPMATKRIQNELKTVLKLQSQQDLSELGWYINENLIENVYQWIIELHSFDKDLPLAQDMKKAGIKSIVMEARFGKDFPMTPPFIRVIKPRFLPFQQRGGGHVTAGGALCMELLTNSGWSAVSSMEAVLLQIRMAMSSTDPFPARLEGRSGYNTYSTVEAKDAFVRACRTHGWAVPPDFHSLI